MGIGMYLSTKKRRGTSPNNANVSLAAADPGISSFPNHVCLQEDTVVSEHRTTTPAYLLTLTLGHKGRDKMLRGSIGLVFAGHWLHYLRNGEMTSDACRSMISPHKKDESKLFTVSTGLILLFCCLSPLLWCTLIASWVQQGFESLDKHSMAVCCCWCEVSLPLDSVGARKSLQLTNGTSKWTQCQVQLKGPMSSKITQIPELHHVASTWHVLVLFHPLPRTLVVPRADLGCLFYSPWYRPHRWWDLDGHRACPEDLRNTKGLCNVVPEPGKMAHSCGQILLVSSVS